jgi:hypothetical protein
LRGGVEVSEGVGGYDHDCFLGVARWNLMGLVVVMRGSGWDGGGGEGV